MFVFTAPPVDISGFIIQIERFNLVGAVFWVSNMRVECQVRKRPFTDPLGLNLINEKFDLVTYHGSKVEQGSAA